MGKKGRKKISYHMPFICFYFIYFLLSYIFGDDIDIVSLIKQPIISSRIILSFILLITLFIAHNENKLRSVCFIKINNSLINNIFHLSSSYSLKILIIFESCLVVFSHRLYSSTLWQLYLEPRSPLIQKKRCTFPFC